MKYSPETPVQIMGHYYNERVVHMTEVSAPPHKKHIMRIKDYFTLCALLLISVAGEIYALENFQGKLHLNLQ